MEEEKCCVVACAKPIDQDYWNQQYAEGTTGWDLAQPSPALARYADQISDKSLKILIPGCGNAHEAAYLLDQGFTDVTVIDIAPLVVEKLKKQMAGRQGITILQGDFFAHVGQYDLILEQTFFCALPPSMRVHYVFQMHRLLKENGVLAGLLFNREFEGGPPFGGTAAEYERLFEPAFDFLRFGPCMESVPKRAGSELFFELRKNSAVGLQLFGLEGVTCNGCSKTICEKLDLLDGVLKATINRDFTQLLLVASKAVTPEAIRAVLSYDEKYRLVVLD